jgi:hypothetical protein
MASAGRPVRGIQWRRNRPLLVLAVLCITPVLASYLAYYVFPPSGRTNYGELIQPQRPVPPLTLHTPDRAPFSLATLRGRWIMVTVDRAGCDDRCQAKLWNMRQVRLTTGKDRDRIERVFLMVDEAPTTTMLLREYEGTWFLRASSTELERFLALPPGGQSHLEDHIWMIDPNGNLMLRWPRLADPNRMKKDIDRLLRASGIG